MGTWRLAISVALALWLAGFVQPTPADERVGRTYWARPAIDQVSVDFYAEPALRTRRPIYEKTRFVIEGVEIGRTFPRIERVYRARFESGEPAYIGVHAFADALYREPGPRDVVSSVARPPGGAGMHLYLFERRSIFESDPDEIAARLQDDGPRRFIHSRPESGS